MKMVCVRAFGGYELGDRLIRGFGVCMIIPILVNENLYCSDDLAPPTHGVFIRGCLISCSGPPPPPPHPPPSLSPSASYVMFFEKNQICYFEPGEHL